MTKTGLNLVPTLRLALATTCAGWTFAGAALADDGEAFYGLRLGQLADGLDVFVEIPSQPTPDSQPSTLTWVAGPDNRLTHIILQMPLFDEMTYQHQKDALHANMTARLGPADEIPLSRHDPLRIVWKDPAGQFEYTLSHVEGTSFSQSFAISLETTDPTRLCGPEDGFDEWVAQWQAAIRSQDRDDILGRFQVPFYAVAPFTIETREDLENLENLWGTDTLDGFLNAVLELDVSTVECNVIEEEGVFRGYTLHLGSVISHMPLIIDRVGPKWMAQGIAYLP